MRCYLITNSFIDDIYNTELDWAKIIKPVLKIFKMDDISQCYAILGIKPTATPEATKKAYRNMAKVWHPDRYVHNPTLKAKAEAEIKKINEAYTAIKAHAEKILQQTTELEVSYRQQTKVSRKQHSPESYYQEGVTLAEQEHYEEALNSFDRAIRLNPNFLEAYQYRGFILSKLGFKLRADAEFRKAHQIKVRNRTKKTSSTSNSANYSAPSTAEATVKTRAIHPLERYQTIFADVEPIKAVAISSYDRIFASTSNAEIKLWQLHSGQRLGTLTGHTDEITCLTVSPSGQTLISGSADRTIKFWDLQKKKAIRTLGGYFSGHFDRVVALAVSPDNQTLLSCDANNSLKIWDINYAKEIQNIAFSAAVTCLVFSPNGQLFGNGGLEPQIRIRQTKDGGVFCSLNNSTGALSLAFSPNGRWLATGGFDCQIRLWDLATKKVLSILTGHSEPISTVLFSNDGSMLISGSWDGTIRLWQLGMGKEIAKIKAHSAAINAMAISSDNQILISGSRDCTLGLWQCNFLAAMSRT